MGGNFKIRALKDYVNFFTNGEMYEFINGRCMWDNGVESCFYESFKQFIERNRMFWKDCFELITVEEGENKMEDLRELIKPCYVVVRRDGSVCCIFETSKGMRLQTELGVAKCYLDDYNEDLLKGNFGIGDKDIMEVYGLSTCSFDISINNRPLIWKRIEKSPTQLKLEELEKKQREIADEMEKLRKEL